MDVNATLKERGKRYGSFKDRAAVCQRIKRAMITDNWPSLTENKKQALEMIADKISRIVCGDSEYLDNWHDIAGYAKLIEEE